MSDLENHVHTSTPENDDYAQYRAVDVGSLDATTRDEALAYIHDLRTYGQLTPEQFAELDAKFRASGALLPAERYQAKREEVARELNAAEEARLNKNSLFLAVLPGLLSDMGLCINPLPRVSADPAPHDESLSELFAHYGLSY